MANPPPVGDLYMQAITATTRIRNRVAEAKAWEQRAALHAGTAPPPALNQLQDDMSDAKGEHRFARKTWTELNNAQLPDNYLRKVGEELKGDEQEQADKRKRNEETCVRMLEFLNNHIATWEEQSLDHLKDIKAAFGASATKMAVLEPTETFPLMELQETMADSEHTSWTLPQVHHRVRQLNTEVERQKALAASVKQLETTLKSNTEQIEAQDKRYGELEDAQAEKEQKITELTTEIERLDLQIKDSVSKKVHEEEKKRVEADANEVKRQELEAREEEQRKGLEELRAKHKQQKENALQAGEELAKGYKDQISTLETARKQLEDEIDRVKLQLSAEKASTEQEKNSEIEDLQKKLQDRTKSFRETETKLEQEKLELETKVEQAQAATSASDARAVELTEQLDSETNSRSTEKDEAKKTIDDLREDVTGLEKVIKQLEDKTVPELRKEVERLTGSEKKIQSAYDSLTKENDRVTKQLEQEQDRFHQEKTQSAADMQKLRGSTSAEKTALLRCFLQSHGIVPAEILYSAVRPITSPPTAPQHPGSPLLRVINDKALSWTLTLQDLAGYDFQPGMTQRLFFAVCGAKEWGAIIQHLEVISSQLFSSTMPRLSTTRPTFYLTASLLELMRRVPPVEHREVHLMAVLRVIEFIVKLQCPVQQAWVQEVYNELLRKFPPPWSSPVIYAMINWVAAVLTSPNEAGPLGLYLSDVLTQWVGPRIESFWPMGDNARILVGTSGGVIVADQTTTDVYSWDRVGWKSGGLRTVNDTFTFIGLRHRRHHDRPEVYEQPDILHNNQQESSALLETYGQTVLKAARSRALVNLK